MRYPTKVRITSKVAYEVLWIEGFDNPDQMGVCDPIKRQIVIKSGMKPKVTRDTFVHEVLHAISFEVPKLNLTENQVELLEVSISKILWLNLRM